MIHSLPNEVLEGLLTARKCNLGRKNRLRVHADNKVYPILWFWKDGFSIDAQAAPHLRGFVDIYDGARHLYQCLVVCSSVERGERIYEFKRQTPAVTKPPVDFARDENAPVGLLRQGLSGFG